MGRLHGLVRKVSTDLQKHVEEHWWKMCQHLGTLLDERVVESREKNIRESRGVAGLDRQSCENDSKRIKQLVQEPFCVGESQAEKLGHSSKENGESDDASTSPGKFEFDAAAGTFFRVKSSQVVYSTVETART